MMEGRFFVCIMKRYNEGELLNPLVWGVYDMWGV